MKRQAKRLTKAKLLKIKPLRAKARTTRARPRLPKPARIIEDPRVVLAREQYATAVGYFNAQKYQKAVSLFEKVLTGPCAELAERARVHINMCRKRLERPTVQLRTAEDHYNYAVAQINAGRLSEAEDHLKRALKQMPKGDHFYYALAAVQSLRGEVDTALNNLKAAIDLDPRNRYLARNDGDFAALYEDPRFADLVYPEA